ncbi:MAG: hypothetical protein ACLS69_04945 [Butyricicoccus sp.]
MIDPQFDYLGIAAVRGGGLDCISVLTGRNGSSARRYLPCGTAGGRCSLLRRILRGRISALRGEGVGRDAVLLLCGLLDTDTLRRYLAVCDTLGLSALVETHDEASCVPQQRAGNGE